MQNCYRLAVLTLLLSCSLAQAGACSKTVRWYDDSPYFQSGKAGVVSGFTADVIREALSRLGCQAVFVKMPFARALVELESGRLDVLPDALRKPERQRFAYFSHAAAMGVPNVLFTSVEAARKYKPQKLEDLAGTGFRLGVQIGVTYGGNFEQLAARPDFKAQLSPVTERRNAWKMVALGRLDGMIADLASGTVELRQLGLTSQVQPSKVVVSTEAPAYAFSRRTTDLAFVQRFNGALDSMAADGSYRAIMDKYLPGTAPAQ
jgi:polar amino acid transport system substrate-binding protein